MRPIDRASILLGAVAVALAACGDGAMVQTAPVKPWDKESDCGWWLSRENSRSVRASIGSSPDGIVLTLADPVFSTWRVDEFPQVELRFNQDPKRSFVAEGWVSHLEGDWGLFGLYLADDAPRMMDRATLLEIRRDNALVFTLPLAATPSQAELEACRPQPGSGHSDSE